MRKIIKKLTGKNLDNNIPLTYLFQRGVPYLNGRLRGLVRANSLNGKPRSLFIGKHVKLLSPKKIYLGDNIRIENFVYIDALSREGIHLGNNVKLGDYSKIICSGSISSLGKGIEIGHDSFFSEYTFFGAAGGIKIGNNVIAGQHVRFHAENHNYSVLNTPIRMQGVSHKGIYIGNDCWLGAGATFLDGSSIGNGCIVAANATVTKTFPDNVIIGGVPAKIIGLRTGER